jgi:uncharacterized lipoprotein YajG
MRPILLLVLTLAGCATPPNSLESTFNACLVLGGAPSYVTAPNGITKFDCKRDGL